jgi:hypothetical protein
MDKKSTKSKIGTIPLLGPLVVVHTRHSDFYKGERCYSRAGLFGGKSGSPKQISLGRLAPVPLGKIDSIPLQGPLVVVYTSQRLL